MLTQISELLEVLTLTPGTLLCSPELWVWLFFFFSLLTMELSHPALGLCRAAPPGDKKSCECLTHPRHYLGSLSSQNRQFGLL